jgi:hypothetical protein
MQANARSALEMIVVFVGLGSASWAEAGGEPKLSAFEPSANGWNWITFDAAGKSKRVLTTFTGSSQFPEVSWSSDLSRAAIWEMGRNELRAEVVLITREVRHPPSLPGWGNVEYSYSRKGRLVATTGGITQAASDGSVKIGDRTFPTSPPTKLAHGAEVSDFAWPPDARILVAATYELTSGKWTQTDATWGANESEFQYVHDEVFAQSGPRSEDMLRQGAPTGGDTTADGDRATLTQDFLHCATRESVKQQGTPALMAFYSIGEGDRGSNVNCLCFKSKSAVWDPSRGKGPMKYLNLSFQDGYLLLTELGRFPQVFNLKTGERTFQSAALVGTVFWPETTK